MGRYALDIFLSIPCLLYISFGVYAGLEYAFTPFIDQVVYKDDPYQDMGGKSEPLTVLDAPVVCSSEAGAVKVANAFANAGTNPLKYIDGYEVYRDESSCDIEENGITVNMARPVFGRIPEKGTFVYVFPEVSNSTLFSLGYQRRFLVWASPSIERNIFRCTKNIDWLDARGGCMLKM